jgi:hypothetical protein
MQFIIFLISALVSIFIEIIFTEKKIILNPGFHWIFGVIGMTSIFLLGEFNPEPVGIFRKIISIIILLSSLYYCYFFEKILYNKYKKIIPASFLWGIGGAGTLLFFVVGHFSFL